MNYGNNFMLRKEMFLPIKEAVRTSYKAAKIVGLFDYLPEVRRIKKLTKIKKH